MSKTPRVLTVAALSLLVATTAAGGKQPLKMRLTPPISIAPGALTIELSIEADYANRFVDVEAEAEDFYRSSRLQVDGASAPRRSVVEFRNLPSGNYRVTSVLMGTSGPRATASAVAKVAPAPGSAR